MDTINDRITQCVKASGLTKTAFAEKIKVTQPYISALCIGRKIPSDRTIADICREFHVNEAWLRDGTGEMFIQTDRDEKIEGFVRGVLSGEQDNFKRRFISVLSALPESDWEVLERFAISLTESARNEFEQKQEDQPALPRLTDAEIEKEVDRYRRELRAQRDAAVTQREPVKDASRAQLEREADEFAEMARQQYLSEKIREQSALSAKDTAVG